MPLLSVSHQQQRQQADCLAACAAMILDYLHVPISYERLLSLLQIQSIGTSFRSLYRLESLGLSVNVGEGSLPELHQHIGVGLPVIAFVDTGQLTSYWEEQTNHAVVIIGIDDDQVYLNDPEFSGAPHHVLQDEFMLAWQEKGFLCATIGLKIT